MYLKLEWRFRGNTEVTSTTNGLGQQLTHGLREIGEGNKKKYSVDMVGKVFDRMANTTEGRLTCIDPVTIAYLNNNTNAKDNKCYRNSKNLEQMYYMMCSIKTSISK